MNSSHSNAHNSSCDSGDNNLDCCGENVDDTVIEEATVSEADEEERAADYAHVDSDDDDDDDDDDDLSCYHARRHIDEQWHVGTHLDLDDIVLEDLSLQDGDGVDEPDDVSDEVNVNLSSLFFVKYPW
jgi:hypothetical protein